jgi:uncharacterized protein (UPF0335 family)
METLKTFEEKIAIAIEKVRALKEEKERLERRVEEMEDAIRLKDTEIERLSMEKASIKNQIEDLLNELETIGLK